jgi:ankyrin repeat protein
VFTRSVFLLSVLALLPVAVAESLDQNLFDALRAGDIQSVKALLDKGISVNAKNADGLTPAMYAALYSSPACLKLLIARSADVNAIAPDGATALMYALPDRTKTALLLEKGANVNAKLKDGKTVLITAVKQDGASDLVRMLLAKGADPLVKDNDSGTTLMHAARTGDVETMRLLLDKGVDVNAAAGPDFGKLNFGTLEDRPGPRVVEHSGFTALIGAAESRNAQAVKLLLEHGANPKAKIGPGFTALTIAAPACAPDVLQLLVDKGADVNAREYRGATPLIFVAASDCTNAAQSAKLLLKAGADWRIKTQEGETALDWALKRGETDVVALLKQAGAKQEGERHTAGVAMHVAEESPADIRDAIDRSLTLIQTSSVQFFRKAGCISCHNQSIGSIAIAAARERGARVDEKLASQILKANLAVFSPHKEGLLVANSGVPAPSIVSTYALLAMSAEKFPANSLTDALVCDLAIRQHPGGWWDGVGARPPIGSTDIESTALTMRALQLYGVPGRRAEFSQRIARARKWLEASKAATLEEKAFRLLGLGWADSDHKLIQQATQAILADRRADGGWAGLPTLASDAYATGLALVALRQGGGIPTSHPSYKQGVRFLLSSQQKDGSWHVKSRALGFQPYFQSGYPYEHDQWISSAGAGWATAALAYALQPAAVTAGIARQPR